MYYLTMLLNIKNADSSAPFPSRRNRDFSTVEFIYRFSNKFAQSNISKPGNCSVGMFGLLLSNVCPSHMVSPYKLDETVSSENIWDSSPHNISLITLSFL